VNPLQALLAAHSTVRRFRPLDLPDETVRRCVSVAQQAATSSHVQAYGLLRVHDVETRRRLVELTGGQPQVAEAGGFFVVCADQHRHRLVAERAGAPYVPNFETFLVAVVDATLFAQNLVVAFESEGLGTCYIGGLRNRLPEVDGLLRLPADVFPLYGLCVGVPEEVPARKPRLPLGAVLFDDVWGADAELLAHMDDHDRAMAAYYEERGKPGHDWTGGIQRKFRRAVREDLFAYYTSKGAALE